MAAYIIVDVNINHPQEYEEYKRLPHMVESL
jgi:uncharacterized protein (DUF1330 family)